MNATVLRMSCVAMLCEKHPPLDKAQQHSLWQQLQDASWVPGVEEWQWLRPALLAWAKRIDVRLAALIERHVHEVSDHCH